MARARTLATGLAALAVLIGAVIGVPVILYRFGGSPFPHHIASWHQAVTALVRQDDGSLLLPAIRDCSWLAWLLFAGSVLAEAQAAVRGHRPPHLRLGGIQGVAARLIALSMLAFAAPPAITLSASVTAVNAQPAGSRNVGNQFAGGHAAASHPAASHRGASHRGASHRGGSHPAGRHSAGSRSAGGPPVGSQPVPPAPQQGYLGSPPAEPGSPGTLAVDAVRAMTARLVTVHSGDCLWSIAQRYLGAGDRYPEIARLNYGRDMGDGQVFVNPALIQPGWKLFLPGGAGAGQATTSHATASQHSGHDTKDPHYRRRHPAAGPHAAGRLAAMRHADTPSAGNEASDPRRTLSARAIARQSAGEISRQAAGEARPQARPGADPATGQLPQAAVFVSGALAGAVLTSLTLLRRRQRLERRRGRRIKLPADGGALAGEQRLRAAAPEETVPLETLRDALASLEAGILSSGQMPPEIMGLHVTPDVLEVLLAAPAPDGPPAPYSISPGRQGMCWQLELPATAAVSRGPAAADPARKPVAAACNLIPGLVTVGATGLGYLLLDLESLQVTGCDGPPALVDQVVTTTATELATGQWSGWYDLVMVGCDELRVLSRAEHCDSLDEALSILEARCAAAGPRIAARAPADVRELRLAEPDNEDWGLTILISRVEPSPAQLQRLLELAEDGPGGIAALVAGDQETPGGRMAPTVLQLAPDPEEPDGIIANIVPLQITVRPRALSATDYDAIATLFAVAAELDDVGMSDEPYTVYAAPPWLSQTAAARQPSTAADLASAHADELSLAAGEPFAADDEPVGGAGGPVAGVDGPVAGAGGAGVDGPAADGRAVEPAAAQESVRRPQPAARPGQPLQVRVLGPFVITGAAEQLQPKQAELVLALALAAPAGLANSALCSMLGPDPDHPKPSDAVRQIITRARRRLGHAGDGQEYIIHAGNGHYLLHPDALLDWTEFRELSASGSRADLRKAVSLIGGQPFAGGYFWWIDVPLIETVRAELVDAAETLAEVELTGGSPRVAARAARTGLLAEPSAEQLWRALMRAEHAAGNLAGVTEAWRRCLDAIEDIAPGGEPHPDTAALYRRLTGQARLFTSAR